MLPKTGPNLRKSIELRPRFVCSDVLAEDGEWGQNERVVLYSRNTFFYTSRSILIPYSELILSVNIVRVKMIRSHRNVLERRCRPEAFQCKLSKGREGRERERREMRFQVQIRCREGLGTTAVFGCKIA